MRELLSSYLGEVGARRAPLAGCVWFAAEWLALRGVEDLGASWRGLSVKQQLRRLKAEGGLVAVIAAELEPRFARTDAPVTGDVGVARARDRRGRHLDVAAICVTPGRWAALRAGGGLFVGPAEPVAAWRIV